VTAYFEYDFSHWPALPKVSCQCLTFGRPGLLAEAVECFLRQDYPGPKELVVVNDQAGVILKIDAPDVRVFNLKKRVATVGGKRNFAAEKSTGEILMPWDDDDIHLPWRISITIAEMTNHHYFKAKRFWCLTDRKFKLERPGGGAPSMGAWSFDLFRRAGRYPEIQSGQDTEHQKAITRVAPDVLDIRYLPDDRVYYLYRWASGCWHLSGWGRGETGFNRAAARAERDVRAGVHRVKPFWATDYVSVVRNRLAELRAAAA
jgi:glycosyltransferase involved in cell wall biosynthesis